MSEPTQKQIASKYKDDLTYYKKKGAMRRLRFWLSVAFFVGGIVWAMGFANFGGSAEFFNTGPISQNHERFKNDCAACHTGASVDMLTILPVGEIKNAKTPILDTLKEAGAKAWANTKEQVSDPHKLAATANAALGTLNLDNIDRACLKCHDGMSLHQPGTKAMTFREAEKELSVVAAAACSTCHKEHIGTARMRLPTSETCVDCHGDEKKLAASLQRAPFDGKLAAAHSQNIRLGDTVQWLPASTTGAQPAVIKSFTEGHPEFLYKREGAKDAAQIKFRHAYHLDPEGRVTKMNKGQVLECRGCHTPDGDGVGIQRISYEQHCQKCHTLGLDPELPGFNLPHHDADKVRKYLGSLEQNWRDYFRAQVKNMTPAEESALIDARAKKFIDKWGVELEAIQKKVFFTGDPPIEKALNGQTLPACVKCHTVTDTKPIPTVAPTVMPDAWLTRGPYKHAPHLHMECTDCHGTARDSGKGIASNDAKDTGPTQDILLPSQKLCAECHRERDYAKVPVDPTERIAPSFGEYGPGAAKKQRAEGGVFDSCLRCHKYHVPAAEMEMGRALVK